MRNPLAPRFGAFREAVNEQHALSARPRIGVIVDRVMELAVFQFEVRHINFLGRMLQTSFTASVAPSDVEEGSRDKLALRNLPWSSSAASVTPLLGVEEARAG